MLDFIENINEIDVELDKKIIHITVAYKKINVISNYLRKYYLDYPDLSYHLALLVTKIRI